jgi:hypothetical protein
MNKRVSISCDAPDSRLLPDVPDHGVTTPTGTDLPPLLPTRR